MNLLTGLKDLYVYVKTVMEQGEEERREKKRKKEQNIHEIWDNYQKVLHMCNGTTRRRERARKKQKKNVHNDNV